MKLKPAQSASDNARALLPKMAFKYFHAGRKAIGVKRHPQKLHAFRLVTKRFRYTLELFRPVYGPQLDRYLKKLRELQSALGKVSDYETMRSVLTGDRELDRNIEHALKGKLRDVRQKWGAFDSDGELKRWRTYLAGDHSQPGTKRRKTPGAKPGTVKKQVSKPRL